MKNLDPDVYWFDQEPEVLVSKLTRADDGGGTITSSRIQSIWARNLYMYFSSALNLENWDSALNFGGQEGELVEMMIPLARSLTRQVISIVTKQKLAFNVLADNTESGTIQTARLGQALVKDIVNRQQLDVVYENMVEHTMLTGMGVLAWRWRSDMGEYFAKDIQGIQHFKGDLEITAPSIWDVDFDSTIHDPRDWQWVQLKYIHNRWDLIAQFPNLFDELKDAPSIRKGRSMFMVGYDESPSEDDLVYVYVAYHKRSPALPEGRMVAYVNDKCILMDDINIYGDLPIAVARPEPIPGCSYGYPYFSNLIAAQEMMDNTISSIATNNSAFGVQAIKAKRGSNVEPEQLWGMNFFYYDDTTGNDPGPEPINFTQSSPEAYKLVDLLKSMILDLSMVNSALRGDPPAGVTSGAAIATLTTTALESVASSSKACRLALRRCMKGSIDAFKRMASVERAMDVGGAGGQMQKKTFQGADLDGIRDIDVIEMNPLLQTMAGRKEEAKELLTSGLITNIKGYFAIIEGAPVSELYQNELSQEDLVKRENEAMLSGEQVVTLNIDDHPYHVLQHSMLLNDPRIRLNKQLSEAVLAHIISHYQEETNIDPMFAAMVRTGKAPMMAAPPPAGDPNQPPASALPPGTDEPKTAQPAKPAKDMVGRDNPGREVA